jgi:competence protein ComEA
MITLGVYIFEEMRQSSDVITVDENYISQDSEELDSNTSGTAVDKSTFKDTIIVEIAGEVIRPSVYVLPSGSRIYQGIEAAGGLNEQADTRDTNLAASMTDGMKVYIPSKKEVEEIEKNTGSTAGDGYIGGSTASTATSTSKTLQINLNNADKNQLQQLTGVGPATAEKIINYRTEYGPFKRKEELMNVSGIGEKTYEKLKDFITVE